MHSIPRPKTLLEEEAILLRNNYMYYGVVGFGIRSFWEEPAIGVFKNPILVVVKHEYSITGPP